jgi:hypothetical protein
LIGVASLTEGQPATHAFVDWRRVKGRRPMKNYSRKTNKSLTRYRTPATFRLRAVIQTQKAKNQRQENNWQQPDPKVSFN